MEELLELLNKIYLEQQRTNNLKQSEIDELIIANCLKEYELKRVCWAQIEQILETKKRSRKKTI